VANIVRQVISIRRVAVASFPEIGGQSLMHRRHGHLTFSIISFEIDISGGEEQLLIDAQFDQVRCEDMRGCIGMESAIGRLSNQTMRGKATQDADLYLSVVWISEKPECVLRNVLSTLRSFASWSAVQELSLNASERPISAATFATPLDNFSAIRVLLSCELSASKTPISAATFASASGIG
jgi:hypothetical protein